MIKRYALLMFSTVLMYGCSEESSVVMSDAGKFDDTVQMEFTRVSHNDGYAYFNLTNHTSQPILFLKCDAFGYANNQLVAQEYGQYLFTRYGLDDYGKVELEPEQTRSALVTTQNRISDAPIDRIEATCTYQASGSDRVETFGGGA